MDIPEWLAPYLAATLAAGLISEVIIVSLLLVALYRAVAWGVGRLVRRRRSGGTRPPANPGEDAHAFLAE